MSIASPSIWCDAIVKGETETLDQLLATWAWRSDRSLLLFASAGPAASGARHAAGGN